MHHTTPTSSPTLKKSPGIEKPPATGNVYAPGSFDWLDISPLSPTDAQVTQRKRWSRSAGGERARAR
eukprot:3862173-Pyramimonas_sp.AAC.1